MSARLHFQPSKNVATTGHVPDAHSKTRERTTIERITCALDTLTRERRYDAIRITDLVARASVGKSTFYEHFDDKDDALVVAMRPVLLTLATAASGRAARSYIRETTSHLWQRRAAARSILHSTALPAIQRRLAALIAAHPGRAEERGTTAMLSATGIAAAQLAMLRGWLTGHLPATIDEMTDQLICCSNLWVGGANR